MSEAKHLTMAELEAGLDTIRQSPKDEGLIAMIVRRPKVDARVIALVAREKDRWPLAGDQLFIDMDVSSENLPPGTRLALGSAVIEVTDQPHTGCKKFEARFGLDALKFVNSPLGRQIHLRGVNAKVTQPGVIRVGDFVKKI